jgi:hypothetical protein
MDHHFFFLLLPHVNPGTLNCTPRQVSRVKSAIPVGDRTLDLLLDDTHPSAWGSSGGLHRIPEGPRGQ